MIDTLRKQRPVFNEVERAAQDTDRVTVDFVGKIDGESSKAAAAQTCPS